MYLDLFYHQNQLPQSLVTSVAIINNLVVHISCISLNLVILCQVSQIG